MLILGILVIYLRTSVKDKFTCLFSSILSENEVGSMQWIHLMAHILPKACMRPVSSDRAQHCSKQHIITWPFSRLGYSTMRKVYLCLLDYSRL